MSARVFFLFLATAFLSGCYLAPGLFTSSLDVQQDGTFTFRYRGEIKIIAPDYKDGFKLPVPPVWKDSFASCYDEATGLRQGKPRDCTPADVADQKSRWEEGSKRKDQMRHQGLKKMFGVDPTNEQDMQRLAAEVLRQPGWKAVAYRGDASFDVDYELSGPLDRELVFPVLPNMDLIAPFVIIRPREDGTVSVKAPGYISGGTIRLLSTQFGSVSDAEAFKKEGVPKGWASKGTFVIRTHGRVLEQNGQDMSATQAAGLPTTLSWTIDDKLETSPIATIDFAQGGGRGAFEKRKSEAK